MARSSFWRLLMVSGGLGTLSLLLVGCSQLAPAPAAPAPTPSQPKAAVSAERVHHATVQQTLPSSGTIRAKQQISVMPKTSGRIEQLPVDIGSQVKAGDTIAVLDQDNPSMQVLQARASLAQAQARVATLQIGARDEDVAAARAGLGAQQARLDSMRQQGRAEDVSSAEAGLASAQARLESLLNGPDEDVRQAQQSAVDSDKDALASAQAAYAALDAQTRATLQGLDSQVETAQAQIASSQAQITSADAALASLPASSAADVQAAQSALAEATAQLNSAQAALKQNFNPIQASVTQAQAAVAAARNQRNSASAQLVALEQHASAPCADQQTASGAIIHFNSTACSAARSAADDAISAAEVALASAQGQLDLLKKGGGPSQQAQLDAAVQQAQAQVDSTRSRLDALTNGGVAASRAAAQAQKQQAQGTLVQAQEALKAAQANLTAANKGNLDVQVKNAQSQVTAAVERLKSDTAKLEVTDRGPRDEDVRQAQAAVDQAQQQLRKARAPYTALDLRQQEQLVAQARAQLDKTVNPFTDQDLDTAQAVVAGAQAQLDIAELGLRETTIVAPVDGVISERLVAVGALVNAQTPLVTLVPPALELVVNVEEKQLDQVALGQSVQLELAAFPGQTFVGSVRSISPTLDERNRTAAVHIEPTEAADKLRAGMFARLNIITGQKQDALVVPRQALVTTTGSADPLVLTVDDAGRVHRQVVRLGLQSSDLVEIVSGVDDGRVVLTSNVNDIREGDIVAPQVQNLTAQVR